MHFHTNVGLYCIAGSM